MSLSFPSLVTDGARRASDFFQRLRPRQNGSNSTTKAPRDQRSESRISAERTAELLWMDPEGNRHVEQVEVRDVSRDGAAVFVLEPLTVGQSVWVSGGKEPLKGVVRHCRPTEEGFVVGILRVHKEQRRFERHPIGGSGVLEWSALSGDVCSVPVKVRNMSEDGLQVQTSDPVPSGAQVRLSGQDFRCDGTVWYCIEVEGGFLVGMQFSDERRT